MRDHEVVLRAGSLRRSRWDAGISEAGCPRGLLLSTGTQGLW